MKRKRKVEEDDARKGGRQIKGEMGKIQEVERGIKERRKVKGRRRKIIKIETRVGDLRKKHTTRKQTNQVKKKKKETDAN